MTSNLKFLRDDLDYLVTTRGYAVGICMDNGNMNYLDELEIDDNGRLTCYLSQVDDYYYVSNKVTSTPNNQSNWIDHLYYKDECGRLSMFLTYVMR
jgi:hypothetical protein